MCLKVFDFNLIIEILKLFFNLGILVLLIGVSVWLGNFVVLFISVKMLKF